VGIIQASIPLFFLCIAAELLWARRRGAALYRLPDALSDLSAGTLSQVAGLFTKLLLLAAYAWTWEHARLQRWLPVPAWPDAPLRGPEGLRWEVAAGWGAAFVLVDLAYYGFHRVSHEVNLFWAGHVVHHSSEEYNLAVALRQSALGGVLGWVFYTPLALLGMPWTQLAVCYALNLVYQFWIHTRAIGRLPRALEAVLNTPSHHRVHHGVNPAYQDRNYAGVFIVWDRWFGTFTPEVEAPVYGLTTPLRSWNPLWVQVHGYVEIARNLWRATSWPDRWRLVFGRPGWRPAAWGGPVVVPPVTPDTFAKYDPAVPPVLRWYALAQFALVVPAALWLLARANTLPPVQLGAGIFYLALTLTNVGGVLEARRWARVSEAARLVALGGAGAALWVTGAGGVGPLLLALSLGSLALLRGQAGHFTVGSAEGMDHHHAPAAGG
jgi:sterol desaturase/sphingolipid hydroxylase (fatty acid hydroxylase superfamily)